MTGKITVDGKQYTYETKGSLLRVYVFDANTFDIWHRLDDVPDEVVKAISYDLTRQPAEGFDT